jgi:CubicO group peptidase (beta-lactamase class C family)
MAFESSYLKYIFRYFLWNFPTVNDFRKFPFDIIDKGDSIFNFIRNESEIQQTEYLLRAVEYRFKGEKTIMSFDKFLQFTGTTAFIIIKDNRVLIEKFYNNCQPDSINTSFSIAKSFLSVLIGIAINDGNINSLKDKVIEYIPELRSRLSDNLTIENLLNMSSGLKYDPKLFPWSDEPKSYYFPDLKSLVINNSVQDYQPGTFFKYSNYNAILLGIILLRTTNELPQKLLEKLIWKRIGMEYPATWSTDSFKYNFAKMESGINARPIDYARFGLLVLNSGNWEGEQIFPHDWCKSLNIPPECNDNKYYFTKNHYPYKMFFKEKLLYYKLGWWGIKCEGSRNNLIAIGNLGQFIYINPKFGIVIVRTGKKWGKIDWWPSVFADFCERIGRFGT